ncbi:hypothetical protein BCO9919_07062 [Burkholderia cenocepacia]|uniref:Uncharacterized protein n=1 Tax=Burkholderia cenocepacia TaxID=95486 RepID=A0A6J5JXE3_9BURK|nr:hypothetical protein BCO9919_07062 [Burkholderia cenocepacia]
MLISGCSVVSSWITHHASADDSARNPATSATVSRALFNAPELIVTSIECGAMPCASDGAFMSNRTNRIHGYAAKRSRAAARK